MTHRITAALIFAGATLAAGTARAQQDSLAGDWTLSVEHLGLKLVLDQKKSAVTGTLDWPHGDPLKLTGMFADDELVLSGDSTGEDFSIHVDSTGTRKADGTLTGTLRAHFDEYNDTHQIVRTAARCLEPRAPT